MTVLQYADALVEIQTILNNTLTQGLNSQLPIEAVRLITKRIHLSRGVRSLAADLNIIPTVIPETAITNSKLEVEYKGFTFFELI